MPGSCCANNSKDRVVPMGRNYVDQQLTKPPQKAIIACEGASAKGEVARVAANLLAYQLEKGQAVRICLGEATTGNSGMLELVNRAPEVISIEGCPLHCGTEILKKRVPDLKATIIPAYSLYPPNSITSLEIFDTPRPVIDALAQDVAKKVVEQCFSEKVPAQRTGISSGCANSCCGS